MLFSGLVSITLRSLCDFDCQETRLLAFPAARSTATSGETRPKPKVWLEHFVDLCEPRMANSELDAVRYCYRLLEEELLQ